MRRPRGGEARIELRALASAGAADQIDSFLIWRKPTHVLEGFAGEGNTSNLAEECGLKAGPLVDIWYGWDLASVLGEQAWVDLIKQAEPTLVMVGFPRRRYCAFNVKMNYKGRE